MVTAAPLAAQEWVDNGTFTGRLAPWVTGGAFCIEAGHEQGLDVTGKGASDSFGVFAGGERTPGPYAPNWIEQRLVLVAGFTYEIKADLLGHRPGDPNRANSDIGTVWAEVGGVEVARCAMGDYSAATEKRMQLSGRFTVPETGITTLRICFQREYLAGKDNPRISIDNVSIRDVPGGKGGDGKGGKDDRKDGGSGGAGAGEGGADGRKRPGNGTAGRGRHP